MRLPGFLYPRLTDVINKVKVKNFKKFSILNFNLKDHIVISGPNNSGKTTLLQAIAAWSEIASLWRERNPDLSREHDDNYPSADLNLLSFHSVPLVNFNHFWNSKKVQDSASIWLYTSQWKIGFEVIHKGNEIAAIRPVKQVLEDDLDKYIDNPLIPIYIPPLSGPDIKEPLFDPRVIPARLAQAQPGSVLRNLLLEVSRDEKKWAKLQQVVGSFFGYELGMPSGSAEIYAPYRHSSQDVYYDLTSAASGFLQVLMVYAVLLAREGSTLLVDEPDAHLHVLLQDKMYSQLREYARENGSQLIVSTHSESLIRIVEPRYLCVLQGNDSKMIANNAERSTLINSLTYLDNIDICLVEQRTNPRILYVEGHTDIAILREWAKKLNHRLYDFLAEPFWKPAVYNIGDKRGGIKAEKHFEALKLVREDIVGIELHDSDGKTRKPKTLKNGLKRVFWRRYEIESYLVHAGPITRFIESVGGKSAAKKASKDLEDNLPPAVIRNPMGEHDELKERKAKNILSATFGAAGINESDYSLIAAQMNRDEIHSEVIEKLDAIADCLGIEKN